MGKTREFTWHIVPYELPPVNESGYSEYLLISFDNYVLPDIGRYEIDSLGNGAFYPGDEERSYASFGLMVNAWTELPKRYDEEED